MIDQRLALGACSPQIAPPQPPPKAHPRPPHRPSQNLPPLGGLWPTVSVCGGGGGGVVGVQNRGVAPPSVSRQFDRAGGCCHRVDEGTILFNIVVSLA